MDERVVLIIAGSVLFLVIAAGVLELLGFRVIVR